MDKFTHTAPKASIVSPLARQKSLKRSSPGPSRQQKDNALALANINKLLQPKKKSAAPSKPGLNTLRYEAALAREKKNEADLEYQLGELRRGVEDDATSSSKIPHGSSIRLDESPPVSGKGKAVDYPSKRAVSETGGRTTAVDDSRERGPTSRPENFLNVP